MFLPQEAAKLLQGADIVLHAGDVGHHGGGAGERRCLVLVNKPLWKSLHILSTLVWFSEVLAPEGNLHS
jgi:hypothetical protein